MRQEAFLEVEPETLDAVEFGRVGRQEDRCQVIGNNEVFGAVPTRTVHQQQSVSFRCELVAELVEEGLHRIGRDDRQHQPEGGVAFGTDGAEQVDGGMALVLDTGRPGAALEPLPTVAPGLADPGLVLQPDLDPLGLGMRGLRLGDQIAEFFLKSTWARRSTFGCAGRVFCQERSRLCSSFSIPFSL